MKGSRSRGSQRPGLLIAEILVGQVLAEVADSSPGAWLVRKLQFATRTSRAAALPASHDLEPAGVATAPARNAQT
jgi:hypothetical protein